MKIRYAHSELQRVRVTFEEDDIKRILSKEAQRHVTIKEVHLGRWTCNIREDQCGETYIEVVWVREGAEVSDE